MISFSGLSTGLDTGSIIDQLVAAERMPAKLYERQKADALSQQSIVNDLSAKLTSLADAADGLDTATEVRALAATLSDDTHLGVAVSGTASPGTYAMRVSQLATVQTTVSNTFAAATDGPGAGSVAITVGADSPVTIAYAAGDSITEIASQINASSARVNASVLFDGTSYQLMVTGADTGAANAVSFSSTGASLGLENPANVTVPAADATLTVNGIAVTRSSNTISDLLPGATFTLDRAHAAGDADTVVQIDTDAAGLRDRAQQLVDAYNASLDVLNGQLTYGGVTRGADTLFGDSTLRGVKRRLVSIVTAAYPHGSTTTSLGQLGIALDEAGKLSIDATKFDAAAAADPQAVEHLLAGDGADGLSKTLSDAIGEYTRSGDGILAAKNKAIDRRIDVFDSEIERIDDNATALGDRLQQQFSALEQVISQLQMQQNYLAGILG